MVSALTAPVSSSPALAACTLRVRPGQDFIRLIPAGAFDAPRGALAGAGPWQLGADDAAQIIAINRSRSADILIDFEHQALLSEHNGQPVPAAGWIDPRSLEFRPDGDEPGLYGRVAWVGDTAALIAADRYRYLSPVFPADPATGAPLDLLHVALTNFPAIDEPVHAALAARHRAAPNTIPTVPQEEPMELLKQLLAALGLPEATSEADAIAAVADLKAKADAVQAEVVALKAKVADPAKFVPVEAVTQMQGQIAALTAKLDGKERDALIEEGLSDGRINPALADWAAAQSVDDLRAYLDKAPAIAALKGMQSDGITAARGAAQPSDTDLVVCRALGLTPEQFARAKE